MSEPYAVDIEITHEPWDGTTQVFPDFRHPEATLDDAKKVLDELKEIGLPAAPLMEHQQLMFDIAKKFKLDKFTSLKQLNELKNPDSEISKAVADVAMEILDGKLPDVTFDTLLGDVAEFQSEKLDGGRIVGRFCGMPIIETHYQRKVPVANP